MTAGANPTATKLVRIWSRTAPPAGNVEFNFVVRILDANAALADAEGIFVLFALRYKGTVAGLCA
jgi:hypothetical protein